MKLTQETRRAIVRAIMADVPEVDNTAAIRAEVEAAWNEAQPPEVREVLRLYPHALLKHTVYVRWSAHGVAWVDLGGVQLLEDACNDMLFISFNQKPPHAKPDWFDPLRWKRALVLVGEMNAQHAKREALTEKLTAALAAITTHARLREAYPEWAHLLPTEPGKADRAVPVVPNDELQAALAAAGYKAKPMEVKV